MRTNKHTHRAPKCMVLHKLLPHCLPTICDKLISYLSLLLKRAATQNYPRVCRQHPHLYDLYSRLYRNFCVIFNQQKDRIVRMSGTSTTLPSTTAAGISQIEDLKFGITDYTVFVLMLSVSAGIGVYFGFFAKAKNTTDEYLRGGKKMQALPIAISLVSRFVYMLFYLVI